MNPPIIQVPQASSVSTATPEQLAVINFPLTGNLLVEAVAGSGKTYTLIERVKRIVEFFRRNKISPHKAIAILAFNNRIAKEIRAKIALMNLDAWCEVGTVHSFGNTILRRHLPPYRADGGKLTKLASDITRKHNRDWSLKKPLTRIVSLARNAGFGALCDRNWGDLIDRYSIEWNYEICPDYLFTQMCDELFNQAIEVATQRPPLVDFDDMLFLPIHYNWEPVNKYPFVLIDEYQDINPTRQAIADKFLDPIECELDSLDNETQYYGSQMLVVGDRRQAIYGFTGAMSDAMDHFKRTYKAAELPLSYCFRCDAEIVKHAQKIVPHIKHRPDAAPGKVETIDETEFAKRTFEKTDAILCRVNAPLMSLAFNFLKQGIACKIEGKDIGENLKTIATKWKITTLAQLTDRLRQHYTREIEKQRLSSNDAKADELMDQWECMRVLIGRCQSLSQHLITDLTNLITSLFSDSEPGVPQEMITLSSVHKSKGLEWPRVYLYGRNAHMPAKFAQLSWEIEQEKNLIYVAITRAEHHLIEVRITK